LKVLFITGMLEYIQLSQKALDTRKFKKKTKSIAKVCVLKFMI